MPRGCWFTSPESKTLRRKGKTHSRSRVSLLDAEGAGSR